MAVFASDEQSTVAVDLLVPTPRTNASTASLTDGKKRSLPIASVRPATSKSSIRRLLSLAMTSVIPSRSSSRVRSTSISMPVESMCVTASASNTNHDVGVGAPRIASWTRPLTYPALAKKSRSSSR